MMYELVCPQDKPICKARFCRRVVPAVRIVLCSRTCTFEGESSSTYAHEKKSRRRNRTMLGLRDGMPDAWLRIFTDEAVPSCCSATIARGLHASAAPTENACEWVTRTTGSSTQRTRSAGGSYRSKCANGLASGKRFGALLRTGQVVLGGPFRIGSCAFLRLLNGARISDEK